MGELLRSHLAHLADFLLQDEVVTWLAHLVVVHTEDLSQGWRAVVYDVLVDLLGLSQAGVSVDGLHVLSGPFSQWQQCN